MGDTTPFSNKEQPNLFSLDEREKRKDSCCSRGAIVWFLFVAWVFYNIGKFDMELMNTTSLIWGFYVRWFFAAPLRVFDVCAPLADLSNFSSVCLELLEEPVTKEVWLELCNKYSWVLSPCS